MSDKTLDAVRTFEQVIDQGYRSLPLFARPLEGAAYGLLAAYDSYIVSQMEVKWALQGAPFAVGHAQAFKGLAEGFVNAMGWLLAGHESLDVHPEANRWPIHGRNRWHFDRPQCTENSLHVTVNSLANIVFA